MIKFTTYLKEMKSNAVVASFGRMSPPTVGHGLLVKKVIETARKNKADHVIYLSRSFDPKKNPLPIDLKLKWAKKMFPGVNLKPADDSIQTFIDMVIALNTVYKTLYMIAGSDRVAEYQKILDKYNGVEYQYDKIVVVSAGERDPDADGAAGMSATKMREAAKSNNLSTFKQGLPTHLNLGDAQKMMDDVRKGMNL